MVVKINTYAVILCLVILVWIGYGYYNSLPDQKILTDNNRVKINTTFYLPEDIMATFLVFPQVKFKIDNKSELKYQWYRSKRNQDVPENTWEYLGEGFIYIPKTIDIQFYLKCKVTVLSSDSVELSVKDAISKNPVSTGPGTCLFDERHTHTESFLSSNNTFRFVLYNILADVNVKEERYPYVPENVLKIDYRRQLILKEVLGYHADILCFQECEEDLFTNYLRPLLELNGYKGLLKLRAPPRPYGSGLFYQTKRFKFIKDFSISIKDAMSMDCNKELAVKIKYIPEVVNRASRTIGQIILLQDRERKRFLIIVNTQLFYKQNAVRTRLLQMALLLNYVESLLHVNNEIHALLDGNDISIMVAGDLNTYKGDTLLDFFSGMEVTKKNGVWILNEDGIYDNNNVEINLKCPFPFTRLSGDPEFTVYVPHCKTTLDYVFGTDKLTLSKFIPLPKAHEIEPYVGIPCAAYPSDHLALVLDIKWKERSK